MYLLGCIAPIRVQHLVDRAHRHQHSCHLKHRKSHKLPCLTAQSPRDDFAFAGTYASQGLQVYGVSWDWQYIDGIWLDNESGASSLSIRGLTVIHQKATGVSQFSPLC
jgi:hypothetical protein